MKKSLMRKYARLIARIGANIQKGQTVRLTINVDQYTFAEIMVDECYKAGASRVDIDWCSQPITKLNYKHRTTKSLSAVLPFEEAKLKLMTEELPCRIYIISDDPDGLNGINRKKMQKAQIARYPIIKPYRDAVESLHQWTIAAIPSFEWAKKVFPDLNKKQAYNKLWDCILASVFVDETTDAIENWKEHNRILHEKCAKLNKIKFDYVTYKSSNGTDFKCSLIPQALWCGASELTKQGIEYNPNMPSEEVFTSPMKGQCEGTLVATKPLSYEGQIIDKFSIRFENGKAVEWHAEIGEKLLTKMISMDENSCMLGELALIPVESPINKSGILYYETLFDENASCHVALGDGYNDTIDGYMNMSFNECKALGVNESMIHVDFMIGTDDLCITGFKDGKSTPIFINGTWAENF